MTPCGGRSLSRLLQRLSQEPESEPPAPDTRNATRLTGPHAAALQGAYQPQLASQDPLWGQAKKMRPTVLAARRWWWGAAAEEAALTSRSLIRMPPMLQPPKAPVSSVLVQAQFCIRAVGELADH